MHYKDGTEAVVGDVVKYTSQRGAGQKADSGVLVQVHPAQSTCNGILATVRFADLGEWTPLVDIAQQSITLNEVELLFRPSSVPAPA